MQSRVRSSILVVLAVLLLALGNRKELNKAIENWQAKQKQQQQNIITLSAGHQFERQQLAYDSTSNRLKNPTLYFEVIRLGDRNYSGKSVTIIETGNTVENASESF